MWHSARIQIKVDQNISISPGHLQPPMW